MLAVVCGCNPNRQAKSSFIDQISEVVDDVEVSKVIWAHRSVSLNVAKEITEGIDRPSKSYDVTNGFKGKLRGSVTAGSVDFGSIALEYFINYVNPPSHAYNESRGCIHVTGLPHVATNQHDQRSDEKFPEKF